MKSAESESGLAHWMRQVITEVERAAQDLNSDAVHDLRVALRRCRSMADGFRAIDPHKSWKKMRRQANALFDSLGELRDIHVLQQWTLRLGAAADPVTQKLLAHSQEQERIGEQSASRALEHFDRKQWARLAVALASRSRRLRPGSLVFQALALEKWGNARRLESIALRTSNPVALHRLRIAIKKFRYLVENFLPQHHEEWIRGLKHVQDVLGEVHDLDVLVETAQHIRAFETEEASERWGLVLQQERSARIDAYRGLMMGDASLWRVWRSGLPEGERARRASLMKLQAWSSFLDSDVRHTRRVARFAVKIHEGLVRAHVLNGDQGKLRELLYAAAVVHEVGRAQGKGNHHKRTEKMVAAVDRLPGWSRGEVEMMARVARYHRGALPDAPRLRNLSAEQRRMTRTLAGILRLANALDADHEGAIRNVKLSRTGDHLLVYADGLKPQSALRQKIAAARHLLELSCRMPVIVRPAPRARPN
jgi:CHAD domain-containing protein